MDYALMVSDYLNASDVGVPSYLDVPPERPSEFLVVELTGGAADDRVMRTPSVDVDCWAQTRARAAAIASDVRDALLAMPDSLPNVFGARISTTYNSPDMDSGTPRYVVGCDITANE